MIWDLLDLTDRDTTPKRPPKGSKISLKHLLVSSSLLWSMFGLVPAALFFSLSPVTGPGQRAQSEGSWGSGQSRWRFSWLPLIPDDDIKVQGPQSGLPHPLGGFSTIFHLYHSMHYLLLRGLSSNGFFRQMSQILWQHFQMRISLSQAWSTAFEPLSKIYIFQSNVCIFFTTVSRCLQALVSVTTWSLYLVWHSSLTPWGQELL